MKQIIFVLVALLLGGAGFYLRSRRAKMGGILAGLILIIITAIMSWSQIVNLMMPYEYRPEAIHYEVEEVDNATFERYALELTKSDGNPEVVNLAEWGIRSAEKRSGLNHIERFRRAGIRSYEGPKTCLECHEKITVKDKDGTYRSVSLRKNLTNTSHFTFAPKTGFSTYGFSGDLVDNFPLGKIDRACGITGTFTWTGWAVSIENSYGEVFSEGCGQCHIVGQYGPISGAMMPFYEATDDEFNATDCLVCHAVEYDMNLRQVVTDPNGKSRWQQDRRLISAMSVTQPGTEQCLRCHQHDMGGDTYFPNQSVQERGREKPRILHPGAKRGTPFGPDWDVHAEAGLECLDCHTTSGHKIARGNRGVDLVANDLPEVEVSCEKCHTESPHEGGEWSDTFNDHTEYIACETCHIHRLYPDNLVFRDWSKAVFNEEEGIYIPYSGPFSGQPGDGIVYKWFNGFGTFMANALGDNPNGEGRYKALDTTPNKLWDGVESFDYDSEYEERFRSIANLGKSKISPFKRFQAIMYEDLNNQGPYGGMILPVDYSVYYKTGEPVKAVAKAMESPIMKKMYGWMFKQYLMNRFMNYMSVDEWDTDFNINRIAPVPMRNEGNLMINHAIQRKGRGCSDCHSHEGILNFDALGYSAERAEELREPVL